MGMPVPQRFEEQYHCYSMACADKGHLEGGDKILLPPSAFDTLARLNVDYPMLFCLENKSCSPERLTHCGVLEFTAEEGSCYVPFWMMQNLILEEGGLLTITNVSLPKATFVKLQPQHTDFLEISNPRAVLEHALRNFSCVTKGDVICVPYNDKNYHFMLKEVQPQDAACIIETDCNVDFDAPLGYVDPYSKKGNATNGTNSEVASSTGGLSPAASSVALGGSTVASENGDVDESASSSGIRIVNGKVIRPEGWEEREKIDRKMIASRTGATGVQSNSAIPVQAKGVDYWALNAGGGARLDGKTATPLKDKDGKEVDVRELRAAAAASRLKALEKSSSQSSSTNATSSSNNKSSQSTKSRKSRVGGKYSKRKQGLASFQGSGNTM